MIQKKPGGHDMGGTCALSFQIHYILPGSKCTDTEKARWAWQGLALVPEVFKYLICYLVQSALIQRNPGGHGIGGTCA